ncbi:hypothetical protein TSUD_268160 [Trifolium subterraneum]|uniref:F-box domain-containing protein n=1 Tax=Trifolium subterraneum TaxID=3900 RepID=A0A2Z6NMP9_TRISU|nr:hypothetical protein TSUD_268160 [Trifolium subterraneum]
MVEAPDDECWELVFKFLKSLSVVSKQFLSITNRLRYYLTIKLLTGPFLYSIFHRFPNLISLHLSNVHTIPTDGLRAFSQNIATLTSLTCSDILYLNTTDMFFIADCFPNLKQLDLNHCYHLSEVGIAHVLRKCRNIRHLNLSGCEGLKLSEINFEVPKLEVLNLSYTSVDDERLYVISKSCRGLLKLVLDNCCDVTHKGVKHVAKNCTKLREISLRGCDRVHADVIGPIVSSRPSLRKITSPPLLSLQ